MATPQGPAEDDIPAEIDFSTGTRGRFFAGQAELVLPVYLDTDVQTYLAASANARGIALSALVNEMLRKDIGLLEAKR